MIHTPHVDFAKELLSYIPPRPDYDTWWRIIAALKNTYDEKTALDLLLWRFQDEKPNEHEKKLKEPFKHIHFGTLVYYAKLYGWERNNSKFKDFAFEPQPPQNTKQQIQQQKQVLDFSYPNISNELLYKEGTKQRLYRVAINTQIIDKNLDPITLQPRNEFKTLTNGFANKLFTIEQIIENIKNGFAFVFAHLKPNKDGQIKRTKQSFMSAELFALDFDGGISIEEALNHDATKLGGLLLYTTANSTPENPRFRIIYQLDFVVNNPTLLETIINKYIFLYNSETNKIVDAACKDATRAFYGNRQALVVNLFTGEIYE